MTFALTAVIVSVVAVLVLLNRRPTSRSRDEVAAVLRSLLEGTLDGADWDYFISVRIRDPALENIRRRCVDLWHEGSSSLEPGAIDFNKLSEVGRRRVGELLKECESLGRENGVT